MKKLSLILLSLLLVCSMLLASCGPQSSEPEDDTGESQNPDGTYSVSSSYLPSTLSASIGTMLADESDKSFTYATMENTPFFMVDDLQISDCKIKSISIPVYKTLEKEDGVFTFTLSVVRADTLVNLKDTLAQPLKKYTISVDAAHYDLEDYETVRKYIKVDLKDYDITLSKVQTLAFGDPDDTLIPAVISNTSAKTDSNPAAKLFTDEWGVVSYYYFKKDGTFSVAHASLPFDVVMERTYENKEAYEALIAKQNQADADYLAKLAAVKEKYEGKYISMMGDSISTCEGVTNNTEYNSTIGSNAVYGQHKKAAPAYHYSKIYWGKVATDLGMNLDVMNAWSGGRVYGKSEASYNDNMLKRSYQLANKQGVNPDLVILYYGINDINSSPSSIYTPGHNLAAYSASDPTSSLYQELSTNKGNKTTVEVVDAWFKAVQDKATAAGYNRTDASPVINPGQTYTSWEAAYALSLYNILNSYNGPEVYIMTLIETNHSSATDGKLDRANTILRAFAEYFGTGLIDQQEGYVLRNNCHFYTYDQETGLHPNIKGHALMAKHIIETLYSDLEK